MKKTLTTLLIITTFIGVLRSNVVIQAAEDQSTITQVVTATADTTPPTVPTSLVATAVSTTQIDLTWTASTDDTAVTGYRIYRDYVNVATTTSLTYSDTGLTPSTLYAYTVTAIDNPYNESAHSATSSATTFTPTTTTPSSGANSTNGGGGNEITLLSFSVVPGFYNATIAFETNVYTQAKLSWGKTPDYEIGSLSNELYLIDHTIKIEDLDPGTLYYFKLELTDGMGRKKILTGQTFKTLSLPDSMPPENVRNLRAVGDEQKITLTWKNPITDFDSVRIVRSDKTYPRDISDGKVVYEGSGERFVDTDVVQGVFYYYTVFSKDKSDNYSSGAITGARLLRPGEIITINPDLFNGIVEAPRGSVAEQIKELTLKDFNFSQAGENLAFVGDTVFLRGDRNLKISLDYSKVPEVLKTIVINLRDKDDPTKIFSFLLRVNKEKTAYEALIAPLERSGVYGLGVLILDHKNQGLKKLSGFLLVKVPEFVSNNNTKIIAEIKKIIGNWSFPLLALLILILTTLLIDRKLRERKRASQYRAQ